MGKIKILKIGIVISLTLFIFGNCSLKADSQQQELEAFYQDKISLINDIHHYSVEHLKLKPTKNCSKFNPKHKSYTFKFSAPALRLPYSYDEKFKEDSSSDLFIYHASATAASNYGLDFLQEPVSRIIFVVFHEIWHAQVEFCSGLEESTGTVIGYIAGLKYAREKYGENSSVYLELKKNFDAFLVWSLINNQAWETLEALYQQYQKGEIIEEIALAKKKEILISVEKTCQELLGKSLAFELNNASIAFFMTYTRYFPLALQVYQVSGEDVKKTIEIFKSIPAKGSSRAKTIEKIKTAEKESARYLFDIISQLQSEENTDQNKNDQGGKK